GLVDEAQLLAVLGADAVRSTLPAGRVENLIGFLDVEFPFGVLGAVLLGIVEKIAGGDAGSTVDVVLHRLTVDQQRERLPHSGVGQDRMLGLGARTLAVDLGPGIGVVELDVLDSA